MKRDEDMYGTAADQNAKANFKGKTIYIPDRSIISIVSKDKKIYTSMHYQSQNRL